MLIDEDKLQLAVRSRRLGLHLAISFDPSLHPRDINGRWKHSSFDPAAPLSASFSASDRHQPTDTQDLHTERGPDGKWRYTKERQQLHGEIIRHFMGGKQKQPAGERHALFTAGGTASGKSTVVEGTAGKPGLVDLPPDAVHVDPDAIKAMLPEYKHMVGQGDGKAAALSHNESIDIAQAITAASIRSGRNLYLDSTGNSGRGKFASKLQALHGAGYKVHVAYVNVPTEEAVGRSAKRAQESGRRVPEQDIRFLHRNVSAYYPDVVHLAHQGVVSDLTLHDNSGKTPMLIHHIKDGQTVHHDKAMVRQFTDKAHEHVPSLSSRVI